MLLPWNSLTGYLASELSPKLEPPKYGFSLLTKIESIRPGIVVSLETLELFFQRQI
jgi:hypothetical protein